MRAGDERLFVLRPDNASIRSAEQLMLHAKDSDNAACSLIINRFSRERVKRKTQYQQSTVESLLDMPALACIPEDPSIPECENNTRTAIECNGPAWTILSALSKELLSRV